MKLKSLLVALFVMGGSSAQAADFQSSTRGQLAQAQPSGRQVLEACVQNRAETLPNPYVDVSPSHWAYKAVLTMHYCGAYRQATPPSLIDRLVNQLPNPQPSPPVQ
ncbi:MAG TPA: hypothetical protein V6D18_00360 [Thermosynechococcaceae cyanobacterium]